MSTAGAYDELFERATGLSCGPFPWQRRLALRPEPARVVSAPTGAGKTEAVLLDWLWRRCFSPDVAERRRTPRRLIVALPMRVLVEQTLARTNKLLKRLRRAGLLERPIEAYPLMGGMADDSWVLDPEAEAVLVGTIDMLLSRALNRGFGRRRSSWPIDFGLVNSDCLWVLDEVQLMDAAIATSCQLQAFRDRFAVAAPARTLWMSATLEPSWLETVDHRAPDVLEVIGVDDEDRRASLGQRLSAPKELVRVELDPADPCMFARRVLREHEALADAPDAPRLTLALANTVGRAVEVYRALGRLAGEGRSAPDRLLLHSRFRPADREKLVKRLEQPIGDGGRIVVSTQVIEAGVDLDAGALVSELAPWPSLVQRAGRLNRSGQRTTAPARFVWLDPGGEIPEKLAPPYEKEALGIARQALLELDGGSFSPDAIAAFAAQQGPAQLLGERPLSLFLRAPDLVDLFDTDPTLDGDDPDVGRFIRLAEDLDVGVAWRDFDDDPNDPEQPVPARDEVCPVPVWEHRGLLALRPWRWSYSRRRWDRLASADDLVPGDLLLLRASDGGYSSELGWTGTTKDRVAALPVSGSALEEDSDADDADSLGRWVTLETHTRHVVDELERTLARLALEPEWTEALRLAARTHDVGKAHHEFQSRLQHWADEEPESDGVYAKAPERKRWRPPFAFRHELVSALLLLERGGRSRDLDLPAYLVGAHHGKFRLTPRLQPDDHRPNRVVCLGVGHGDQFPEITVAGERFGPTTLDLSLLRLGELGESTWIERSLDLLDDLGPFRLAYLEALLRAADQRASAGERRELSE
ncbi:MAG TPA: CRISPR-associated helicase Cas3' [Gaiellaceae bacterium]|nr:CRISPR-associated helicase Cas3' [Gaiellaceae bacterium]